MQQLQQQSGGVVAGSPQDSQHRRDTNVVIYLKRRLAMCYRCGGGISFRNLSMVNEHENERRKEGRMEGRQAGRKEERKAGKQT